MESPSLPRILVVDDSATVRAMLASLLDGPYEVAVAEDGVEGLAMAQRTPHPDLILLDVEMPGLDGFEVCARLKADPKTRDIRIVFLTSLSGHEDERRGLRAGAADYIAKPISFPTVLARVKTQLENKAAADYLRDQAAFLRAEVERQTALVSAVQDATVLAMASLAETRDSDTGNHIRRTQHYVRTLAERLAQGRHREVLTAEAIAIIFKTAPLHDIGKVGIPDRILLKPGRLTAEEFEVMKLHTVYGRDALAHAEEALSVPAEFLRVAKEIAYSHQEKWDGSGYPEGLSGETIPLSARLMALADVYDALISRRVYKEPMPHAQAVGVIRDGAGSHFDPEVVEAFLSCQDEFARIADRFADSQSDLERKRVQFETSLGVQAPQE